MRPAKGYIVRWVEAPSNKLITTVFDPTLGSDPMKRRLAMDMNLSFSVLTANIISILLIGTLYLANRQKAEYDRDMRLLQQMMITIGIANISDCCVYYLTGSSNIVIKVLVFLSGSGLFLGNVMIGYLWAKFIMVHMNIPFSDIRRNIYRTIGLISIVLLVINIFYPLVFSVSDGRYQRGFAYIIFLIFAAFYILDSLYLYVKDRSH